MKGRTTRMTAVVGILGAVGMAVIVLAGPLDPPPGPVSPTMKTLEQIEPRTPISSLPFTISQPGSYYVTGNLSGVPGQHGIIIMTGNVTVDLGGFTLTGGSGSQNGVHVGAAVQNVTIKNGSVDFWTIGFNLALAAKSMLLSCDGNHDDDDGGVIGDQGKVEFCRFVENGGDGMVAAANATVDNTESDKNTGTGFVTGPNSSVFRSHAGNNGGQGMSLGNGSAAHACNTPNNGTSGLVVGQGATVAACISVGNGGDGINAAAGAKITDCTTRSNGGDGIEVGSDCYVLRNTCGGNGTGMALGAGINITSSDNRIEENNVTDNDWGIRANAPTGGSLIIRNSASGNTTLDYDIAAANSVGLITTVTGVPIPATTNAWANFIF